MSTGCTRRGVAIGSTAGGGRHPPPGGGRRHLAIWLKQKAWEEFAAAMKERGHVTFESLRDASRAHLAALGETDALARVVWGLATDFERKEEISLRHDPEAWTRLSKGYVEVVQKLVKSPSAQLLVPFLAKDETKGPIHLERELTASILQALAERDPDAPPPAKAPEPKQRFWSKLLG
jgi:hypothetical protein